MRFQAHVADRVDAVVAFVHDIGFGDCLVRITDRPVNDAFLCHFGFAGRFQILLVNNVRLYFKGDFNRPDAVFRNVSRFGRDSRDDVAIPVAVIAFVLKEINRVNASHLLSRFDVQASDRRAGVFAGQQSSVKRPFLIHVCSVFGKAGSLVDTVEPGSFCPDQFVRATRSPRNCSLSHYAPPFAICRAHSVIPL